jgi:hypothetical protein
MFLRVVRAPSGKRGIKHEYVRVVEAYRDHEGKTRHQTVINLGRKDLLAAHLDLDKLNRLHGDKPGKPSVEGDDVGAGDPCWSRLTCGASLVWKRASMRFQRAIALTSAPSAIAPWCWWPTGWQQ